MILNGLLFYRIWNTSANNIVLGLGLLFKFIYINKI